MFKRASLMFPAILLVCRLASGAPAEIVLNGGGATFPYPLYAKWIERYHAQTGVRVLYEATGSGAGIRSLLERRVDFGATDAFLSDTELEKADSAILHIPTCVGAVAVVCHLPGRPTLQFTPDVLADVFLGRIRVWNHASLKRLNPGVPLPELPIRVVHRADSSGTTFLFTAYLSRVSKIWQQQIGSGKKVNWPTGMGVDGNGLVAGLTQKIPGSIAYVSATFADRQNLPVARILNRAGYMAAPTTEAIRQAAAVDMPDDTRLLLCDTDAAHGYPISGFSYLIVYREQAYKHRTREQAEALVRMLNWMIHGAQRYNHDLAYARLSKEAVDKARALLATITFKGTPVLPLSSHKTAQSATP